MKCDIQRVVKNPRYRILIIDEEQFILDIWGSFWKIVFPFFFWMLPNSVFKIDNPDIAEKLTKSEVKQSNIGMGVALFVGGISVLGGNLLTPYMDNFNFQGTKLVRLMLIAIAIIIVFSLFFYITQRCKKGLYRIINLEQLTLERIWIRPRSSKHFFRVLFFYLFFLSLTLLFFVGFYGFPNVIGLLVAASCFFILLLTIVVAIKGDRTTVEFKRDNDIAI
ncbi:DUF443 family protein [Lentibacillus sp. Marseille-P4043]|uniref:DUF443 family protein n=1 Tax=Lentibacillus sp. Marseille-P4043 TaxID=2040293 RepID=UPI000D0ABA69|nr:DUF443 family protein [Lentibacillus sp. Marseille-P4043]